MAKRKKKSLKYIKEVLELRDDHQWRSRPGYQIFVAGRGAVRFDVPQGWILKPQESSFRFSDREPPDDDCALEVSFNQLPPGDWKDFPLVGLVKNLAKNDERDVIEVGEVVKVERQTAQIVWTELKFMDSQAEPRPAYSRICVGLGSGIQCLITYEYWEDQAEIRTPVWDVVLESLTLGLYIRDPRTGLAFPD